MIVGVMFHLGTYSFAALCRARRADASGEMVLLNGYDRIAPRR